MGRTLSGSNDEKEEKDEKSSKKENNNANDNESETSDEVEEDLDEEHFIVEKIIKMRTTKKGKVQCKQNFPCQTPNICFPIVDLLKWKGFSHSENTWVMHLFSLD